MFKHKCVVTTQFTASTVEWELVLVLYFWAVWACTWQPGHGVSFSTHSLCSELSSVLDWTGTMCQIISVHAQPETHSGTYKGILHHSKRSSYLRAWASRGLIGGFVAVNTSIILLCLFLYFSGKFCCDAHTQMSFKASGLIGWRCFCSISERARHKDERHERKQCRWCFSVHGCKFMHINNSETNHTVLTYFDTSESKSQKIACVSAVVQL